VIGKENTEGLRVYQVVIRVKGEGCQAVIKVRKGETYKVNFVGAATLHLLATKVRNLMIKEGKPWRDDRYPPT
jgi:hypothetical protein